MVEFLSWFCEFILVCFGVHFLEFPEQATLFSCCTRAVVIKPYLVSGFFDTSFPGMYISIASVMLLVTLVHASWAYIFWVFRLEGPGPVCWWCEETFHSPVVSLFILPHFALVRRLSDSLHVQPYKNWVVVWCTKSCMYCTSGVHISHDKIKNLVFPGWFFDKLSQSQSVSSIQWPAASVVRLMSHSS